MPRLGRYMCCMSLTEEELAARERSRQLDRDTAQWKLAEDKVMKLLLLGAGESGKSTIVKQMRIIHTAGFTEEERRSWIPAMHKNIIEGLATLVTNMVELNIDFEHESNLDIASDVVELAKNDVKRLTREDMDALELLWQDEGVQCCYGRRRQMNLSDGIAYLLHNISIYKQPDYIPKDDDILHIRVETKGIIQVEFTHRNTQFSLYDVGGQRKERRKWVHCMDNCNAVLFCASLSEYDAFLAEDQTVNRMKDSLSIFKYISNSEHLANVSLLLFLNKTDLLEDKVSKSPISRYFPKYQGPNSFDSVASFIEKLYMDSSTKREAGKIFVHRTCATNTNVVRKVFEFSARTIIMENLEKCGLM
ncbi:guanine nucleotide-binding protein G(i) subunit alpha-1-like [Sycon ciliatum]|uniref:guanine nucleotide-binding protein G(i) subunit alpha-1-like n=1 Tax=Sycon ciliatum TaxID=27933 RepID=UPI0031F681C5